MLSARLRRARWAGKSGYTSKAGRTFVGAVERDGRRLLVSMMDIGGNTYRTPEQLFTWAFANTDRLTPVGQLAEPSSPAPTFDRAIRPLPEKGQAPTAHPAAARAADAPTSTEGASGWGFPGLPSPSLPALPAPLTLLTWAMLVVVALRTRVYWIAHRNRTGVDRAGRLGPPAGAVGPAGGAEPVATRLRGPMATGNRSPCPRLNDVPRSDTCGADRQAIGGIRQIS